MRQLYLDKNALNKVNSTKREPLRIMTWNLRNPSMKRAIKQCKWLESMKNDVFILTELKSPKTVEYFRDRLTSSGYNLFYKLPARPNYYTVVGTVLEASELQLSINFLPPRAVGIKVKKTQGGELSVIGLYVPSRGPIERRNVDKRTFQQSVTKMLDGLYHNKKISNLIIGGDLNVVAPDHIPRYEFFGDWEYEFYEKFIKIGMVDAFRFLSSSIDHSWFGRNGDGYRFDHIFVSRDIANNLIKCYYESKVRNNGLSDHSAMILELAV